MADELKGWSGSFGRMVAPVMERINGLGLLQKLIVGIFVPILGAFLVIGGMLFVSVGPFVSIKQLGSNSLKELGEASVKESMISLNRLGELIIQDKADGVAKQIEIYLESHPGLPGTSLVQRVGETGYTAVHNSKGINYFHVNPKIVGTDLHNLADKLPDFVKLMDKGLRGPVGGYYQWKDVDGKVRSKYMFTTPVEGANLIVAATTYIDEFGKPAAAILGKMNQMEGIYAAQYGRRVTFFLVIVLLDLVVLLGVIYLYSTSVVRPIRHLSDVADRISMGDLEATVTVEGKGEVAKLAWSIERMRMSVKTAIERLESKGPVVARK
jgi:HAMP domain-containing protein